MLCLMLLMIFLVEGLFVVGCRLMFVMCWIGMCV